MSCPYFTLIEVNRGSNKEPLWFPKGSTNANTVRIPCSARLSPSLDTASIQIGTTFEAKAASARNQQNPIHLFLLSIRR